MPPAPDLLPPSRPLLGDPDVDPPAHDPLDGPAPDAFLLYSFGGPEQPDDVVPFLEHVTAGRGIPRERLAVVGSHYLDHFDGRSPINDQNRALLAALREAFGRQPEGSPLRAASDAGRLYWGNRHWHPFLADELARMRDDGVVHALAFVTSLYPSASGCRQYREALAEARAHVGPGAPRVTRLRYGHDHPGVVEPFADATREALASLPDDERDDARLVFTAHSIPTGMADASGPDGGGYTRRLRQTAQAVVDRAAPGRDWDLVFQSRSGPPHVPWLEPDVGDHVEALAADGVRAVVVVPVGFISDHVEVRYDLDIQAAEQAEAVGVRLVRASTPGTDPRFVDMVVDLARERLERPALRRALVEPLHDACPVGCCLAPGAAATARPAGAGGAA